MNYVLKAIEITKNAIGYKSVKDIPVANGPFGKANKECLEYVLDEASKLGFKTVNLDGYCGYAEIGSGDEIVGIVGHLDVVPEGNGWKTDPYVATTIDNVIYGRGVLDDKGPIIISLLAIKALVDEGITLNKRVRVIFGCDEENGSQCMEHYLKVEGPFNYGVTPDSSFPVIFSEREINSFSFKGKNINYGDAKLIYLKSGFVINAVSDRCEVRIENLSLDKCKEISKNLESDNIEYELSFIDNITTFIIKGKASHGSTPELGINAGSYAIKALDNIIDNSFVKLYNKYFKTDVNGKYLNCYVYDEYGPLKFNVGIITLDNDNYEIKVNSRIPRNTNTKIMESTIKETLKDEDVDIQLLSYSEGLYVDPESILIKSLLEAYQNETKDYESKPICCCGGTYAREFKNCVAFGPECDVYGKLTIHEPDEHLPIDAFYGFFNIYKNAYKDLILKVNYKK